jgi:hypothetical protein
MAKAGLPEPQSPESVTQRLPERRLKTGAGPCGVMVRVSLHSSWGAGAMLCQGIKGGERGAWVALARAAVMNMGSPKGRESYGDGVAIVVGGVTSVQSGDR